MKKSQRFCGPQKCPSSLQALRFFVATENRQGLGFFLRIFEEKKRPNCGLAGDEKFGDRKSRRFAIAIFGALSTSSFYLLRLIRRLLVRFVHQKKPPKTPRNIVVFQGDAGHEKATKKFRQEKRAQRLTFGSEAGGLAREGVVAEKFVPSLESLSFLGFEETNLGCPENFAGMSQTLGVFRKFVRKSSCAFFVPYS